MNPDQEEEHDQNNWPATAAVSFATTRWTMVIDAARADQGDDSSNGSHALAALCERYWSPVYAFIRKRGYDGEDAKDLTQGFFAQLIEKRGFGNADPKKGRFRTYLLGALKFFLSDEYRKANAKKRGGDYIHIPMETATVENEIAALGNEKMGPDLIFDREWSSVVLAEAKETLRQEYARRKKEDVFEAIQPFLSGSKQSVSHEKMAAQMGMSDSALKMAISRLRKRFGVVLRERVAETLAPGEDVESEIRALIECVSS